MTVRPIIFSAPMVKALLEGRKTMTRRIVTRRNVTVLGESWAGKSHPWEGLRFNEATVRQRSPISGAADCHLLVPFCHPADEPTPTDECGVYRVHPVIEAGDLLWVRETIQRYNGGKPKPTAQYAADITAVPHRSAVEGWCDGRAYWQWQRPTLSSIHMPRWASRLTLKVTAVKVERLQEISATDAEAEGVFRHVAEYSLDKVFRAERSASAIQYFRELWESIHGAGAWETNPWVTAISFEVIAKNVDEVSA